MTSEFNSLEKHRKRESMEVHEKQGDKNQGRPWLRFKDVVKKPHEKHDTRRWKSDSRSRGMEKHLSEA
ncbi:hypothetical protein CHS0354_042741 [Potamilus streckersoni]|uniref:Uncharacterized protein n=1 Tax=Potamilus streckersoni TaxID=2493646 RepID=A0AAE0S9S9_9BIVA|nr:hypothetical protein CHS0354_042741 [Potamilus streckersoni]